MDLNSAHRKRHKKEKIMNPITGQIQEFSDPNLLKELMSQRLFVPIAAGDMTEKQTRERQVSKYDSRSKLGKMFGLNRAQRRAEMRSKQKEVKNGDE